MKFTQKNKYTPQKSTNHSNAQNHFEEGLMKDFMSPFMQGLSVPMTAFTPIQKQPQYLLSPSPAKKDLFSQLLGNETTHSPLKYSHQQILEDASFNEEDSSEDSSMDTENDEIDSDNEENQSQENGLKKRKRKSSTQIKILKQELDGEMNWTKEKIIRMAHFTGLSQSQVYKWCWDQKKKQHKSKHDSCKSYIERRKIIKKDTSYHGKGYKYDDDNSDLEEKDMSSHYLQTKLKSGTQIQDHIFIRTEKKIKKRLFFA